MRTIERLTSTPDFDKPILPLTSTMVTTVAPVSTVTSVTAVTTIASRLISHCGYYPFKGSSIRDRRWILRCWNASFPVDQSRQ